MQETVRRRRSRYVSYRRADLSWQQKIRGIRDPRGFVADGDVRRSRMTIGVTLPEIGADMQPVYDGSLRYGSRRSAVAARRRQEEERLEPMVDRHGLRGTLAAGILAVLLVILLGFVVSNASALRAEQRRVAEVDARITRIDAQCDSLSRQYDAKAAEIDVVYMAVGRGMVASSGLDAVSIEVPETAVVRPSDSISR